MAVGSYTHSIMRTLTYLPLLALHLASTVGCAPTGQATAFPSPQVTLELSLTSTATITPLPTETPTRTPTLQPTPTPTDVLNPWEREFAKSVQLVAVSKEQYPELEATFGDMSLEVFFHESMPDNGYEAVVQDPVRSLQFVAEVLRQHQISNGKQVGTLAEFTESLRAGTERFDVAVIDADTQQMVEMTDLPINGVKVMVVPPNSTLGLAVPIAFGQTADEDHIGLSIDKKDPITLLVVYKANNTSVSGSQHPYVILSGILHAIEMFALPNDDAGNPGFGIRENPAVQITPGGGVYEARYPIFHNADFGAERYDIAFRFRNRAYPR